MQSVLQLKWQNLYYLDFFNRKGVKMRVLFINEVCGVSSTGKISCELADNPYALENMYDDFEYVTRVHLAGKKICTLDEVISNFNFGGMSTKKSFKEAMKRVKLSYGIYKKHGMSRFYWFHRFATEMGKLVLG